MNNGVTRIWRNTRHASVYPRKGTQDRPKQWLQQVNMEGQWVFTGVTNECGRGLLISNKDWKQLHPWRPTSTCGLPHNSRASSLHSSQAAQPSQSLLSAAVPCLPTFYYSFLHCCGGTRRIFQVSVPWQRWLFVYLLSLLEETAVWDAVIREEPGSCREEGGLCAAAAFRFTENRD